MVRFLEPKLSPTDVGLIRLDDLTFCFFGTANLLPSIRTGVKQGCIILASVSGMQRFVFPSAPSCAVRGVSALPSTQEC